jgi:hypothetical protein
MIVIDVIVPAPGLPPPEPPSTMRGSVS